MKRSSNVRALRGNLSALLAGATLVAAAGCAETATEDIEQVQSAITGVWQPLTLQPGWTNYNGTSNPPAIGKVNGVLTLRGAINGQGATSPHAFDLPAEYRPVKNEYMFLRIVTANHTGGALYIDINNQAWVYEDGVSTSTRGPNTFFTSLDGVSFDDTAVGATALIADSTPVGWTYVYGHRHQGDEINAVSAKVVSGFVRFQGYVQKVAGSDPNNMFLFQLPPALRPTQSIYVPTVMCGGGGSLQSYGRLNIIGGTGNVYVEPETNNASANCSVSFEGVSYAFSPANQTLNYANSWSAYSARAVRVRATDGVVRFQGGIHNGTGTTIATMLPASMRPPVNVYLQADALNAARARIVVTPGGTVYFDTPSLNVAQGFLSLDSVSYGLP